VSAGPTVVYLAGSGRSGSTLLERTLGGMPGFVNVGELIDLFRRVAPGGERCGCGQPFAACPFWSGVGARAFGGWDPALLDRVRGLQGQVARQRRLPRLLAPGLAGPGFREAVAEYGGLYARLYQAIADQAGARCVVDASKWPVQALALARAGLDVRVIHLVRDVRGVAHSLGKQAVSRPHAVAGPDVMWHLGPASAAARWQACQSEAGLLRHCGVKVTRLRYEDFVARPRECTGAALTALGVAVDPAAFGHIGAAAIRLGSSHGLSGNPARFAAGEIALRPDEAWRTGLRGRDRAVVTAIGLPHLLRHHLPQRARPQRGLPRRGDAPAGPPPDHPAPADGRPTIAAATADRHLAAQAANGHQPPAEPAEWPLVSVILPTHQRPDLVRESIASVVAQDYPGDIECIVVHDREAADPSLAELARPGRSVTVTTNTRTPGLPGARNTGLGVATGAFLAGCDDDDVWHPGKLRLQLTRLLGDPGLLAVGSGMRLMLPSGKITEWPGRADVINYRLLLRNRVKELHSSTLVMRREAVDRAGLYDEDLPGGYGEDYDWVLRLARSGPVGAVAPLLADVRKDQGSWYYGRAEMTAAGLEHLLAKHPDIAGSRRGHARILGQIALARSVLGERRQAARYVGRAFARWPLSLHASVALVHIATGIDDRHLRRVARLLRRGMA
jgi:glycosyl transferase family 2